MENNRRSKKKYFIEDNISASQKSRFKKLATNATENKNQIASQVILFYVF